MVLNRIYNIKSKKIYNNYLRMHKLVIVGIVATVAAAVEHPVNQQMVEEIKRKATTWTPMEVDENPLSQKDVDQIYGLVGAPFSKEHDLAGLPLMNEVGDY